MDRARRSARWTVLGVAATLLGSAAMAVAGAAPATGITVSPRGTVTVVALGNGHGHGLSQYGARGTALAGLSTQRILAFYYPGTKLVRQRLSRIRVNLSGVGAYLTVAPAADLQVSGVSGVLPTAGVARYRLVPDTGPNLALQTLGTARGSSWQTSRTGLPDGATFHRVGWGALRVFRSDGTSWSYFGFVSGYRNTASGKSGGLTTVNRVGIDNYTAGVVPSEMPTSWAPAAVNAQAVAARTYGANAKLAPAGRHYDICDTTWCQVYGGHAHYDSRGRLTWTDYQPAAQATSNQLLQFGGSPIFAQFSASNGGWSVAGEQPYLTAHRDPYDNNASGDPYLNYRTTVPVATVARYFKLRTITQIVVSQRDGHGTWDGRVVSGYVVGTTADGKAAKITATGYDFASAFGIGTTWFTLRAS